MITILWGGILATLFLFLTFWTPVKAPAPKRVEVVVKTTQEVTPTVTPTDAAPEVAPAAAPVVEAAPEITPELVAKGQKLYMANCTSCHNKDPNIKGALGPSQVNTPYEVFKVKVVTGRYPEVLPAGYTPERKTKQMKKFPNLEKDVPALYAWIQSMKKK